MSEEFKPGDMVEFIGTQKDAEVMAAWGAPLLIPREIYTVEQVYAAVPYVTEPRNKEAGVDLRECPSKKWAFPTKLFRLIHRPRAEFLTELLSAPVLEEA